MGSRGPKPKPTVVRLLEGNPGRLPINELEPACELPPVKPVVVQVDEIANAEWDRLMAAMPPNLYTAMDTQLLALYAVSYSISYRAQVAIAQHGLTEEHFTFDKEGNEIGKKTVANPAIDIWKKSSETLLKCVDRLGLAPSVRTRLQVPKSKAEQQSKFAGLIGRSASKE